MNAPISLMILSNMTQRLETSPWPETHLPGSVERLRRPDDSDYAS